MSNDCVRITSTDKFTQFLIDSGKFVVDVSSPLGACKRALEQVEQRNEDRFIESVLNDVNAADIESLDAVKSLKRLYKVIQVVNKAITQDKINRFKTLTVNGIINQESLSDDNFELFVNIIDELTDTEYSLLVEIYNIEKKEGKSFNMKRGPVIDQILEKFQFSMDFLESYIYRLKAMGLLTNEHGFYNNGNTLVYKGIVDGKLSDMATGLIKFIEEKGI